MPLSKGYINPLNAIGQRKLTYIPPHFAVLKLQGFIDFNNLDLWIYTNLNSRYCIRKKQVLNDERKIELIYEIGLEEPGELSMLSLTCPYLQIR